MKRRGGGISLQISEGPSKIVLDQFLLDAKIRAIGALDTYLNNEEYQYATVLDAVATPWYQTNPVKPLGYAEGYLRVEDILMIAPLDPAMQRRIQLMPGSQRAIFYVGAFAIQANLSMGSEMKLSEAIETLAKRFLTLTDISIFPMFTSNAALPDTIPIALLNRAKISLYHAAEE